MANGVVCIVCGCLEATHNAAYDKDGNRTTLLNGVFVCRSYTPASPQVMDRIWGRVEDLRATYERPQTSVAYPPLIKTAAKA